MRSLKCAWEFNQTSLINWVFPKFSKYIIYIYILKAFKIKWSGRSMEKTPEIDKIDYKYNSYEKIY